MVETWLVVYRLLAPKQRRTVYLLLFNATLIAFIDVVGVASILPFIAVAVDPSIIHSNSYLQQIYQTFHFSSDQQFLILLGGLAFTLLLLSNGLSALDAWFSLRFWYDWECHLSVQMLNHYLALPYDTLLTRNTAELSKIVLHEIDRAVSYVLMSGLDVLTSIIASAMLLTLLILVDPTVAFTTLILLACVYLFIFFVLKTPLRKLGHSYATDETEIYRRTKEALEGAKEIKLAGKQALFADRFAAPKYRATKNIIKYDLLGLLPQKVLETVTYGGMILIVIYLLTDASGSTSYSISLVALYAFAAYRLIPSLKQIFGGIETLHYHCAILSDTLDDFRQLPRAGLTSTVATPTPALALQHQIELRDVRYRYPNATDYAVKQLNLTIPAHSTICLAGQSGAGKSTTIDLITGLLKPTMGEIKIDGITVTAANIYGWQHLLGYVAPYSYLTDDTIAENIAFGVTSQAIDHDKVAEVAKIAAIHDWITTELDNGYVSRVGDHGVRLSAGQRQRIGIARALYHNPQVLILDEATNALDRPTEDKIFEALFKLANINVILLVSHRPWLAERCETVYILEHGEIVCRGSYQTILDSAPRFRKYFKL